MKCRFLILSTLLCSGNIFAGTMGSISAVESCRWFGSASVGPMWAKAGETQTFFLTPDILKSYQAHKNDSVLAQGELFVGLQKSFAESLFSQFGLAVAVNNDAKLNGIIYDEANVEFANHSYDYKIKSTRLFAKGKLFLDKNYFFIPWIGAGVGVAFNNAHDFNNQPLIFEALPNSNFRDNNTTAFTYSVSAGLQTKLDEHWQFGVGYEFSDWGKSRLDKAPGQTLNSGLEVDHVYTSAILFNFTYVL